MNFPTLNYSFHLSVVERLLLILIGLVLVAVGAVSRSQWVRRNRLLFKFFWIVPLVVSIVTFFKLWVFAPLVVCGGYVTGWSVYQELISLWSPKRLDRVEK